MPNSFPTLTLTRSQAAERMERIYAVVVGGERVFYDLGMGGRDPSAEFPWTKNTRKLDCTGWVASMLGYDRKQSRAKGGYINSSEIVRMASVETTGDSGYLDWFDVIPSTEPILPMDVLAYGWHDEDGDGKEDPGHGAIVRKILPGFVRGAKDWYKYVEIIDCSPHNSARAGRDGHAVFAHDATVFRARRLSSGQMLGGTFVRYRNFLPG